MFEFSLGYLWTCCDIKRLCAAAAVFQGISNEKKEKTKYVSGILFIVNFFVHICLNVTRWLFHFVVFIFVLLFVVVEMLQRLADDRRWISSFIFVLSQLTCSKWWKLAIWKRDFSSLLSTVICSATDVTMKTFNFANILENSCSVSTLNRYNVYVFVLFIALF